MKAKTKKNKIEELTKHVVQLYHRTNDLNERLKVVEEQDYKKIMAEPVQQQTS